MALLFSSRFHSADRWLGAIKDLMPELETVIWPDVPDPAAIEFALVWAPKPGELKRYPNLKGICSFGAGVEHILRDPDLPAGVPIVKIVDTRLTGGMTEYVLLHVLRYHRKLDRLQAQQRARRWELFDPADTPRTTVGILGLGHLGAHAGRALAGLGFAVIGWSRTAKQYPDIESFQGPAQLEDFLRLSNFLVCLLPLTPETTGIINKTSLAALPKGAFVINAGRGPQVVDADLLAALDSGHIAGATLDVFQREPLDPAHPYWSHPLVTVTPHNASDTIPESTAPQIVENIRRARAGQPLLNLVDPRLGY